MLVIIAFKANLPAVILPDKLSDVLINVYLRYIPFVCITHFDDAYDQFAATHILDNLTGITVCSAVSTAGAWFHDKLVFTVWANTLVPLLYTGQAYLMAA